MIKHCELFCSKVLGSIVEHCMHNSHMWKIPLLSNG